MLSNLFFSFVSRGRKDTPLVSSPPPTPCIVAVKICPGPMCPRSYWDIASFVRYVPWRSETGARSAQAQHGQNQLVKKLVLRPQIITLLKQHGGLANSNAPLLSTFTRQYEFSKMIFNFSSLLFCPAVCGTHTVQLIYLSSMGSIVHYTENPIYVFLSGNCAA
jgi:hypothetical protein